MILCERFGYIDNADVRVGDNCHAERLQGLDLDLVEFLELPKVVEQFSCSGSHRSLPVVAAGQLGQEDEEAASLQKLRLSSVGRRPGSLSPF